MLEFLMYRLREVLPEDEFNRLIAEFSISDAQRWLDLVRNTIGVDGYDEIKKEFRKKEEEEEERRKTSEMNCCARRKTADDRKTIFQLGIGADKRAQLGASYVDNVFLGYFEGL